MTKQAEAAIVRMKERVEDQKSQCKGFSKNLKEKKVEDVDGGVASGTPGPDNFAKLGKNKKLPPWLKTYLKKNGWKGPGDSKVVSAAKKQVVDSKKSEVETSPSTATAATGASNSASNSGSVEAEDGDEEESKDDKTEAAQASKAVQPTEASGPSDSGDAEATGNEDAGCNWGRNWGCNRRRK